jgi:hypothetical protein
LRSNLSPDHASTNAEVGPDPQTHALTARENRKDRLMLASRGQASDDKRQAPPPAEANSTRILRLGTGLGCAPYLSGDVGQLHGTGIGSLGTSVATDTCGQESPLKFSSTICEYWI